MTFVASVVAVAVAVAWRWRWWDVGGSALAGDVGASVVACWRGDGVLTLLPPARWCPKRRDPTINMRW